MRNVKTLYQSKKMQTSSDLTHLCDGRLICGDTAKLLVVWSRRSRQPQHQCKQTLVPAERFFGQLTAGQRRVQGQVKLDNAQGRVVSGKTDKG